jgi:hypothetical protein
VIVIDLLLIASIAWLIWPRVQWAWALTEGENAAEGPGSSRTPRLRRVALQSPDSSSSVSAFWAMGEGSPPQTSARGQADNGADGTPLPSPIVYDQETAVSPEFVFVCGPPQRLTLEIETRPEDADE